jgi:Zn-dependent M16 (insulinase) family peptidase
MASEETQQAERLARIEAAICQLSETVEKALKELKESDARQQTAINSRELICSVKAVEIEQIKEDVNQLKNQVKEIEKYLPAMKVVIWIGGITGSSLLILIWQLITGQVQLVIP